MTLATAAVRALLGQASTVEIGLALRGKEVQAVDGYARVAVPFDRWTVRGARATTEVTFGPMGAGVDYDAGLIVVNGEPEQLLPNAGGEAGRIPPGASLRYTAEIKVIEEQKPRR